MKDNNSKAAKGAPKEKTLELLQVEITLNHLASTSSLLTDRLIELEGRLGGVLQAAEDPVDPEKTDPGLVPIAHRIHQANLYSAAHVRKLEDLLSRLELSG